MPSPPTQSDHSALSSRGKTIEASPFGSHYQRTSTIKIEPLVAPLPASGPWVPAEKRTFNPDEEDVFGASEQWGEEKRVPDRPAQTVEGGVTVEKTVSLSQLLDNVVILEESIKELTAIVHARRSLPGIDALKYL